MKDIPCRELLFIWQALQYLSTKQDLLKVVPLSHVYLVTFYEN